MVRCWLFSLTEENWLVVRDNGIFGVPEKSRARELVKLGDILVFYVSKKGSRSLGGMIVGVYKAVSAWFREDKPLWVDEVRDNVVKYPWRIRVEPIKLGLASYKELASKLSFVENKEYANAYLVGTPANLGRPIPEGDLKIILETLI